MFPVLAKHIKSRDQCMVISSYMVTIADQEGNSDFKLQKCEHFAGCMAALHGEDRDLKEESTDETKDQDEANAELCVKKITEFHGDSKGLGMEVFAKACAKKFPT